LPSTPKGDNRVLFLSKGSASASTRYRCLDYFDRMEESGFAPRHMTVSDSRLAALRAAAGASVVVVLRKTFSAAFCHLLRRVSRRLVFDFDDAVFCSSRGEVSRTRQKRFARMVRLCDRVWAGNRFLAETAAEHNPSVAVVPTAIDTARYTGTVPKPADSIDLVWIGSRSTSRYLEGHLGVLERMAAAVPNLRLKIVADFSLTSRHLPVLPVQWSQEVEVPSLAASHIGIAPMSDDTWTKGKCALKVLQYMAAGLPVISSAAGANREVIDHGRTGLLAGTRQEWVDAATRLAGDAALREKMGAAGRERVAAHYSQTAVFTTLQRDLTRLAQP